MLLVPRHEVDINYTNVPQIEEGIEQYNPDAVYNQGMVVQHNSSIWECLKNNTQGLEPIKGVNWEEKGKVNYLRVFDPRRDKKTTNPDEIRYIFNISDVDTLALFGLKAKSVKVIIRDAQNEIIEQRELETYIRVVYDWNDWTYARLEYEDTLFIKNLPMIFDSTMEVIIENLNDTAECAHLVFGRAINLGITIANDPAPERSIRKDIVKSANGAEVVVIYERLYLNVLVRSEDIDLVFNRLRKYIRDYVLVIGDDRDGGHSSLTMYGEYKNVDIPAGIFTSMYELEIEGVTYE